MSNFAQSERQRLTVLLRAAGPDAPTLCTGWTTRDLAAHLVLRERRMDAAAGIRLTPLAGWTARVQEGYRARPYEELLRLFRTGPPVLSPFALPGADEAANVIEHFVHAEDVRRAGEDWQPEAPGAALTEVLWRRLPMLARMEAGRKTPVRLVLRRPDGRAVTVSRRTGAAVEVTGEPGELVLFAFGRGARAEVTVTGPTDAVEALRVVLPFE
ncbi:TIGR03085 family metal-binding protein [Kitasatospora sp. NPDC002040]|uniref:TIGR03085 family metal-binding protein n=1 Tax=Kitasatospora sp. NPDC002040 TaxID=3154661 RepID=UPI00332680BF